MLASSAPYQIDPTTPLTSPSHVKWAMEIIGQGFNLPIEEHSIILQAMGVYSAWILKADSRPVAIQGLGIDSDILQDFFQVSSLLLIKRRSLSISPYCLQ